MTELKFTATHRQLLEDKKLPDDFIDALERDLPLLRVYVADRPPARQVREVLERAQRRAEEEAADFFLLFGAATPALVEAAQRLANNLDREPGTQRDGDKRDYRRPDLAMLFELKHARRLAWAASESLDEVPAGRKQEAEVSGWPVILVRQMLDNASKNAPLLQRLTAAGRDEIICICLAAASGKSEEQDWSRWLKAGSSWTKQITPLIGPKGTRPG